MFDPAAHKKAKEEKEEKTRVLTQIKTWCFSMIPIELQAQLDLDVREVVCGDPSCAPIDTVFTLIWLNGGRGLFAIPARPDEITQDDLIEFFPDDETLSKWQRGLKATWPPVPELRFKVTERVECRIGPHPVKGWAPGRVVKLNYREPSWPPNMMAPYQILLHDGRLIFAPQDTDQVIRLREPAAQDAPSSPEIDYDDYNQDELLDELEGEGDDGEEQS